MIRSEIEYSNAVVRLQEEEARIKLYRQELQKQGFVGDELTRLLDPLDSFHLQLREEVESYERLRQGEVAELNNLRGLGHALISLRIARNVSQNSLAAKMGVDPSQVSRDERNEYHGITLERAARILEALGVGVSLKFDIGQEDRCAIQFNSAPQSAND